MEIPDFLKVSTPHLPVQQGMVTADAAYLSKTFYGFELDLASLKKTQVFVNQSGQYSIELIDLKTNEVLLTFVNRTSSVDPVAEAIVNAKDDEWALLNPLSVGKYEEWLGPVVELRTGDEIRFLDAMAVGATYPTDSPGNELPYRLASLLNHYQFLGRWVSGTMGNLSTAGFTLIHKGSSEGAPENFLVDQSAMCAIIQINHGVQKGYVCLRT